MVLIDNETYKLLENNYHKEVYDKTQIIIGHTGQNDMLHYNGWVYRLNGKNKKTATFTITKNGKIYQHYNPIYYSSFVDNQQDKASISIVLENLGWFKKDSMIGRYVDWLGNNYKKNNEEVLCKRWRNYTYWDLYTNEQIISLKNLVVKLCENYDISKNFIGHNVFDDNVDLFKGITFRSNYHQESTDVSPAFDMEILKNI
jgi:N-acetyl-anhydromuramyl-L-alanine amidase AmpD